MQLTNFPTLLLPLAAWALAAPSGRDESDAPSYRDRLVSLHKALVEIPSITLDETAVGEFLISYLDEHGFTTERQALPATNGTATARFNVLAWPGERAASRSATAARVLLTTHMDVVPPHVEYGRRGPEPPTAATVLAGRGSVDAKGGLAAQVVAAEELAAAGDATAADLMLLFVVGEEVAGDGMLHYSAAAASGARPDLVPRAAAVFAEPTAGRLACGHKGVLGCDITASGRSAHSGYPWLGKSAVDVLMRALVGAQAVDFGRSERFGNTTLNVGRIEGGVAANVVPDRAAATVVFRVAVGPESGGDGRVRDRFVEFMHSVDDEAFELDCGKGYGTVELNCDVEGFETEVMNYGTDVPNFKVNTTNYLYGPGSITVAHRPDEDITLGELEEAVEGYKKLVLHAMKD